MKFHVVDSKCIGYGWFDPESIWSIAGFSLGAMISARESNSECTGIFLSRNVSDTGKSFRQMEWMTRQICFVIRGLHGVQKTVFRCIRVYCPRMKSASRSERASWVQVGLP